MSGLSRRHLMGAAGALGVGVTGLRASVARADESDGSRRRRLVATPAELGAAFASAQPGDVIMMKNGTWRDLEIKFRATGTAQHPITLRAQVPGKVVISGSSYLQIIGDHLVVDGLTFRDGAAPLGHLHVIGFSDWPEYTPSTVFSTHCRLTNVVIDRFNKEQVLPAGKDVWIGLWGQHNRVDHCAFLNKTSYDQLITGWRPDDRPNHWQIDSNYFSDIPNNHYGDAALVIRLGDSWQAWSSSYSVIEKNVFENMEGIGKIVSLKCSNNAIRDNTFWKASGAMTSRHGNFNTIERNFIFPGVGTEDGRYSGGIRVIGEGHVVRGNYIQGCRDRGKPALSLFEGNEQDGPGVGGYSPTKDVLIENNTFVDNDKNILVGAAYNPDRGNDVPVENITYRENVIAGNDAADPVINELDPPIGDLVYESNQFWGGNLEGLTDIDGIAIEDPGLVQKPDGTYRYSANSKLRHNITTTPLTKADVGPTWHWS